MDGIACSFTSLFIASCLAHHQFLGTFSTSDFLTRGKFSWASHWQAPRGNFASRIGSRILLCLISKTFVVKADLWPPSSSFDSLTHVHARPSSAALHARPVPSLSPCCGPTSHGGSGLRVGGQSMVCARPRASAASRPLDWDAAIVFHESARGGAETTW
jgi:hypothetical protein